MDHKSNESAIPIKDGSYLDQSGTMRPKITTQGWYFQLEWKDRTMNWIPLKDLKDDYPMQLAEYVVRNNLQEETAFKWWVPGVLNKKDRMVAKIKSKYWTRTHKYGIQIPKSIKEALRFDREDVKNHWRNAIEKEMSNAKVDFEVIQGETQVGYKKIHIHWIFDVKLSTFQSKARLVANGNVTGPPQDISFSSVVSRESVRIFFLLAALNDTEIMSAYIQNAYLIANTT